MATRNFHWSSVLDCVMHETDENGDTIVEYTHEPGPYGPLVSENRRGTEHYHHYDALGSTTFLSDTSGNLTDTIQYDAWGNEVARTGTTPTPYKWVGRWGYQYDSPTGSCYIRERSYRPTVARWMSVDQFVASHFYRYALNSPQTTYDPSGMIDVTYRGRSEPSCEERKAQVDFMFKLEKKAMCHGFIVQQVSVTCEISDCKGKNIERRSYTYYEAWRMRKNSQGPVNDRANYDNFNDCEIGFYQQASTVIRFYCNRDLNLPDDSNADTIPGWNPRGVVVYYPNANSRCRTTPGRYLTSTGTEPVFWPSPSLYQESTRTFDFTWHCCPKAKPCCGDAEYTVMSWSPEQDN